MPEKLALVNSFVTNRNCLEQSISNIFLQCQGIGKKNLKKKKLFEMKNSFFFKATEMFTHDFDL